jgi:hypothetical protein
MNDNDKAKAVVAHFPRGAAGSKQNAFRMWLWGYSRNFFSAKRLDESDSIETVVFTAIRGVQDFYGDPGFWPEGV